MEMEKSAEAMWKQIFQIQKYDPVNWKLKWNINPRWEVSGWGVEGSGKGLPEMFLKKNNRETPYIIIIDKFTILVIYMIIFDTYTNSQNTLTLVKKSRNKSF